MYNPKTEVYSLLSTLGYNISQASTNEFNEFPAITYTISNDAADVIDMDNNMLSQDVDVTIDIWTIKSTEGSSILSIIEELFRANNYILSWSSDVPNIDTIYHTQARFKKIFV
jgi:hypothetical protein